MQSVRIVLTQVSSIETADEPTGKFILRPHKIWLSHRNPAVRKVRPILAVYDHDDERCALRRRRRHTRLHNAEMVDDEPRVGVAVDKGGAGVEIAPEQDVDREIVTSRGTAYSVEARVVRRAVRFFGHDNADADRARRLFPV